MSRKPSTPAGTKQAVDDPRHRQGLRVIQTLESKGFPSRFAGGCVRDRLIGIRPHDYDIATTALPEESEAVLSQAGYRTVPTGKDHGTITVVVGGNPVEVTTLRKDVETDGRRAKVDYVSDFALDAARRDFTINAMYEDAKGEIYDYFKGRTDLDNGVIRFVGDPKARIEEDYLRILRFFRFSGPGFSLSFDPPSHAAIQPLASGLIMVSKERVTQEVRGILGVAAVQETLKAMVDAGVLDQVFGGAGNFTSKALGDDPFSKVDEIPVSSKKENGGIGWLLRLAYLLRQVDASGCSAVTDTALKALKLSNKESRALEFCLTWESSLSKVPPSEARGKGEAGGEPRKDEDQTWRWMEMTDLMEEALKAEVSESGFFEYASRTTDDATWLAALSQCRQSEAQSGHLRRSKMPVSGQDLMDQGCPQGERLGRYLTRLKRLYRNGTWKTRAEGLDLSASWLSKES